MTFVHPVEYSVATSVSSLYHAKAMVDRVTISLLALSIVDDALVVYLDKGALPKQELDAGSSLPTVVAGLVSHVGGRNDYVEQLYTFSFKKGEVTVAYLVLVPGHEVTKKQDTKFFPLSAVVGDRERAMLTYALQRLKWKVEYTNVVYSLLPETFTLTELQKTYEAILDKLLDKRNFRKKILSLGILKSTGKKRKLGVARPAAEYSFKDRILTYVEVL
jgi:8-oxo-dGTP diphosphatase